MKKPITPEEFDQLVRATFSKMHPEAQMTPIVLAFPAEVIERLEAYRKEHSLDRKELIYVALEAQLDQIDEFSEEIFRLMQDPNSFHWPLADPLLCVALAFMRKTSNRWANKVDEKFGLNDDESDEERLGDRHRDQYGGRDRRGGN
jgi:hypothetical protein